MAARDRRRNHTAAHGTNAHNDGPQRYTWTKKSRATTVNKKRQAQRISVSLFDCRWQDRGQRSKFLLHCNKQKRDFVWTDKQWQCWGFTRKTEHDSVQLKLKTHTWGYLWTLRGHSEDTQRSWGGTVPYIKWGAKKGKEVIQRPAPLLWTRKRGSGQRWYLWGPCGRALPVSRSVSSSCLCLIGPPVLLMHAATANPLWASASCRGLSTAEDVNNTAGEKRGQKTGSSER